ncbi:uncharacterized protein MONOS_9112 [Monocercomonoides exilis]|uniref:uncharacterized protein n=1 Tax=Monocercomonoides exilis TaxID=2049356 RepID=UPI0035599C8E|nr:hypothetical protein MONOS_9112 [Monocercomonoides exilis]|eukprot:MONOS_9112.1-p1 / transcript=MONOS_9112.1 / gene=MONOS_9112 / organism=Monocercomonoides_exilis_PA203 / gene_product=unspecified product / transcript_product=unspecified product / location=Mono_scaffold00365:50745-51443(-) / protein_length=233 / sequence_SO=supercontig / SO=protein_coding / is_pseudo=false
MKIERRRKILDMIINARALQRDDSTTGDITSSNAQLTQTTAISQSSSSPNETEGSNSSSSTLPQSPKKEIGVKKEEEQIFAISSELPSFSFRPLRLKTYANTQFNISFSFLSSQLLFILDILRNLPPKEKAIVVSSFISPLVLIRNIFSSNSSFASTSTFALWKKANGQGRMKEVSYFSSVPPPSVLLMPLQCFSADYNLSCANTLVVADALLSSKDVEQIAKRMGKLKEMG